MTSHTCKYPSAATTTNGYKFTGHALTELTARERGNTRCDVGLNELLDNPRKSKDEILADRAARDALAAQRRGNKGRMR